MKDTPVIGKYYKGVKLNYMFYEPDVPSENLLICLHGSGEIGPADGLQLRLVENHGYPQKAAQGFPFPFNIIAPQIDISFSILNKIFPQFCIDEYDTIAGVTGYSLGGQATYGMAKANPGKVKFIAPVCGKSSLLSALTFPNIEGQAWHGTLDTKESYYADRNFIYAYNLIHTDKIELVSLAGVGHNAWDPAYDVRFGSDKLLQWVIDQFQK